jgi:aminopeptidase
VKEVDSVGWENGLLLGNSQNLARQLMEAPANFLTPTQFSFEAEREMADLPVELVVREEGWFKEMGSFLRMSRGSIEPAKFLEMTIVLGETASQWCWWEMGSSSRRIFTMTTTT